MPILKASLLATGLTFAIPLKWEISEDYVFAFHFPQLGSPWNTQNRNLKAGIPWATLSYVRNK